MQASSGPIEPIEFPFNPVGISKYIFIYFSYFFSFLGAEADGGPYPPPSGPQCDCIACIAYCYATDPNMGLHGV